MTALTTNKFHIPVAVTLADAESSTVSSRKPKVAVRITDVLGASFPTMDVSVDSAMRVSDRAVIMAKTKMQPVGDGVYEVDMMAAKPGRYLNVESQTRACS